MTKTLSTRLLGAVLLAATPALAGNSGVIVQSGGGINTAEASQRGRDNAIQVVQFGEDNLARVKQRGRNNHAEIGQEGDVNEAVLDQEQRRRRR